MLRPQLLRGLKQPRAGAQVQGHHFQGHSLVLVPAWSRCQGVAPLGNSPRTAVVTMETGQKAAKPAVSDASKGRLPGMRLRGDLESSGLSPTCWLVSAHQRVWCRAPRGYRREYPRELGFGRRPERPNLLPVLVQASVSPSTMRFLAPRCPEGVCSQPGLTGDPTTQGCRPGGEPVGPAQGGPEPLPTLPPQSG